MKEARRDVLTAGAQSKKGYCMLCAVASLTRKHWSHKHYSPSEVHNNLPSE